MRSLFFAIYTFHMPLFVFISGMFSKNNINKKRYSKIFSFLVLYLFIKLLICVTNMIINRQCRFSLLSEDGVPWYAFAIFFYCLVTIAMKKFPKTYTLLLFTILPCFVGFDNSITDFLMLSRIIVFYPFFLVGYYLDSEYINQVLSGTRIKIFSALSLVGFLAFVFYKTDSVYWLRPLLTGRNPFSTLGTYRPYGPIIRLTYYVIVTVICAMIISLIPNQIGGKTGKILESLGKRSVQVYTIHEPVIIALFGTINTEKLMRHLMPTYPHLLVFPLAILITLFCSSKLLEKPFDMILHPKINIMH